jgi:hypothetical protein
VSNLSDAFSALSPNQKAVFLARVAHEATISAREAYIPIYDKPDGLLLQQSNEFVHRVTGYITCVLARTEREGQDASVMQMIVKHFRLSGREHRLVEWLGDSKVAL